MIIGILAVLCAASSVRAQAPADDPFKLTGDSGLLVFQVKPDKEADFESAWTAIKAKLTKTDKADWKELGEAIKVFKVAAAPAPNTLYVFQVMPPPKMSFEPKGILYDSGLFERAEADALYAKIGGGFAGLIKWPLSKVIG